MRAVDRSSSLEVRKGEDGVIARRRTSDSASAPALGRPSRRGRSTSSETPSRRGVGYPLSWHRADDRRARHERRRWRRWRRSICRLETTASATAALADQRTTSHVTHADVPDARRLSRVRAVRASVTSVRSSLRSGSVGRCGRGGTVISGAVPRVSRRRPGDQWRLRCAVVRAALRSRPTERRHLLVRVHVLSACGDSSRVCPELRRGAGRASEAR